MHQVNQILNYCLAQSTSPPDYLKDLERYTYLNTLSPQMLTGAFQGRLLSMISKLVNPTCIFEIGAYTGYSGLCLAEGLAPNGSLYTCEVNKELYYIIENFAEKSPYANQIKLLKGRAEDFWEELNIEPDLIFIDAGKKQNLDHYHMVFDRLKAGGLILVDNVLWAGKVVVKNKDNDTNFIHQFNSFVKNDKRVEQFILPIRDGLTIIRKK